MFRRIAWRSCARPRNFAPRLRLFGSDPKNDQYGRWFELQMDHKITQARVELQFTVEQEFESSNVIPPAAESTRNFVRSHLGLREGEQLTQSHGNSLSMVLEERIGVRVPVKLIMRLLNSEEKTKSDSDILKDVAISESDSKIMDFYGHAFWGDEAEIDFIGMRPHFAHSPSRFWLLGEAKYSPSTVDQLAQLEESCRFVRQKFAGEEIGVAALITNNLKDSHDRHVKLTHQLLCDDVFSALVPNLTNLSEQGRLIAVYWPWMNIYSQLSHMESKLSHMESNLSNMRNDLNEVKESQKTIQEAVDKLLRFVTEKKYDD